jgi:MFS family permease
MVLLVITRRRLPEPDQIPATVAPPTSAGRVPLPPQFLRFAVGTTLCTAGLVTFGLISFSLVQRHLVPTAGAPLLYAAAMAAEALAALATGEIYDRLGPRVLLGLPLLVAGVPALAFGNSLLLAVLGILLWGVAVGVQDSTVKALVADLVVRERRATAYGVFAALQGAGALVGGIAAGALYSRSVAALVIAVAATSVVALLVLLPVLGRRPVSA